MRAHTVLVFSALVLTASSFLIKVPTVNLQPKPALVQTGWLRLQKMILPFFENVCEESVDPDIVAAANDFDLAIAQNSNFANSGSSIQFMNVEVITNLQKLLSSKGLIPKGEIFTEHNEEHLSELKIIYEVLCFARNFESFYKAAAWARQNVNCGLFVDAIYLSLMNRRETNLLSIPAPYEILPNYFIRKDYIAKASSLMSVEEPFISEGIRNEGNSYIVDANYTADYYNNADESVLAYFHEDIGLNSYYFLRKLKSAPWFIAPTDPTNTNGEFLFFTLKQLAARYDLERYSNGLPELDEINWANFKIIPYDSKLIYSNGENFASRLYDADITETDITDVSMLKDIEDNISNYVNHMVQYVQSRTGYNRKQIMNNLMEILITKEKSYNEIARKILNSRLEGKAADEMKTVKMLNLLLNRLYYINTQIVSSSPKDDLYQATFNPSVPERYFATDFIRREVLARTIAPMDHYMTSLRDPMFWQLNKKIINLVDKSLDILPKYTRSTLYFPGIEIISVDAKKMMTMCDNFEIDVTDALKSNLTKTPYQVKFSQQRLNHKPFSIKITVDSRIRQQGVVKIFLGPKTLPGELSKKKNSFMLLDCFDSNFKLGLNVISRSSGAMTNLANDFETLRSIRRKVLDAEFGIHTSPSNSIKEQTSFPARLIIPKGSQEGLSFQLFVFITPYITKSLDFLDSSNNVDLMSELISSPGYPLDLSVDDFTLLDLPNAMLKDIVITHKEENKASTYGNDGGASKFTNDYTYDPLPQNQLRYGKKQPFDYQSKRGEYGTKQNIFYDKNGQKDSSKYFDNFIYDTSPKTQPGEYNSQTDFMDTEEGKKSDDNVIDENKGSGKVIDKLNLQTTDLETEKQIGKNNVLKSSIGNQNKFDYKAKKEENEKKRAAYKNRDNFVNKDEKIDNEIMEEVKPTSKITSDENKEDDLFNVIPLLRTSTQKLNDFFITKLRDELDELRDELKDIIKPHKFSK